MMPLQRQGDEFPTPLGRAQAMANFPPAGPSFGDLTTLADVKAWLQTGQSAFPATDDALLTRLITAASQYIQTWLNRQIALQDWIEVRDGIGNALGPGEVRYQFAAFPVSAVSLVVVDGLTIPPIPVFSARATWHRCCRHLCNPGGVPIYPDATRDQGICGTAKGGLRDFAIHCRAMP